MEDARWQPAAIGLPERGSYLAVSAETPGAGIENLPGVGPFLRRRGVSSVWRLRADEQVGLVAVSQDRNVPVIRDLLAEVATGPVGISPDFDDALDTSRALETAAVARRCLPPSGTDVASIDDDWAAALLACAPEISGRVVHRLLGRVADLAPADRDILLTTLRTWIDCGGNGSAAARQLYATATPYATGCTASKRSAVSHSAIPGRGRPVHRCSRSQAP